MTDLTAFLNDRLAEDEAAALAAGGQTWHQHDARHEHGRIQDEDGEVVTYDEGRPTEGQAAFIARHDPARVLREVAAKRAMIETAAYRIAAAEDLERQGIESTNELRAPAEYLLSTLAAVYSDHPDYREEWAV